VSTARLSPTGEFLDGLDPIAPGDYDGQPVKWNGAEYVPLALGDALVLEALASDGVFTVQSADTLTLIAAGAGGMNLESDAAGFNLTTTGGEFALNVGSGLGVFNVTTLGAALEAVAVSIRTGDSLQFLALSAGLAQLAGDVVSLQGTTELDLACDGSTNVGGSASLNLSSGAAMTLSANTSLAISSTELGFYNAPPVARPSITGVLPQDQIDSIVAALVALGLVTDGR
jgi:hypothetical protein